jgi:hypothetical protein
LADFSQVKKAKKLLRWLLSRAPTTEVIVKTIESFEDILSAACSGRRSLVVIRKTRGFSTTIIFEKHSKFPQSGGK